MNALSLEVVFSADWNVFSYDPNGLLAHLVWYFFGDWCLDSFDHLPSWEGRVKPPQFGPPGPQQAGNLPAGWEPTPPPLYYGRPSGPYLPPPWNFRPSAFMALMNPHPRAPLEVKNMETGESGGENYSCWIQAGQSHHRSVFFVTIKCASAGQQVYFQVPSDIEWWTFRLKVCKHLGVKFAKAQPAHRQFHDILYGSLCRLRGTGDWKTAMLKMEMANNEDAMAQLGIIDVASPTLVRVN
jgi:hypothetical protein